MNVESIYPHSGACQTSGLRISTKTPWRVADERQPRILFPAQCRLLAERTDRGLPIDLRSIANLFPIFRDVILEEAA
jgi:hypothetical protein